MKQDLHGLDKKKVARRRFLKGIALGSAVVASSGALEAVSAAVPVKFQLRWDKEWDVVVLGSGIAGMSAAIEAADAGASVVVLEREAQPGGLAKFSGGHMSVAGTDVQARLKVVDKPDWLYNDMMENSEMTAVPELVRTFVDNGPEQVMWLQQLGVRFANYFVHSSGVDKEVDRGHEVGRSPDYPGGRPSGNGGLGMMLMLFRAAGKKGVLTLLEHKMTHLIRPTRTGPVIGIEIEKHGKKLMIKANRGVIIATGGYSGNSRMCMAEDPRLTSDILPDGWPYMICHGEGHLAAVNVGAELSNMAFGGYLPIRWGTKIYQLWEPPNFSTVPKANLGVPIADFQRVILIKSDGRRYVNEMLADTSASPAAYPKLSIKPADFPAHPFNEAYLNISDRPRNVWAVTDAEGAKALGWQIDEIKSPNPKAGSALYRDMVATADTISDLATKIRVDIRGLNETVGRYNRFVDGGKDEDFGKPNPAYKIVEGPFYGVKLAMLRHTRRNGIRVNTKSQVLDRSQLLENDGISINFEKTIPRLYAAGECANYLGRYHSHGTLGLYSFYGRVAGRNAAAEEALS